MKNAWRLFRSDVKRLFGNVVSVIIVLGLVAMPSIFSWYNILACWNVFDNTGNLTVAVANSDEGYESDLVPLRVNIGEQVVSALRANDQLDWTFTDEADAIDGVESGEYYAAVVIPPSFSRDMMTFYSQDAQRASIVYYANEKKNAIAPKVTDQGADQVSAQVNQVFTQTLSEVALGVSSSLANYLDEADASGAIAQLAGSVGTAGDRMASAASLLRSYAGVLDAAAGFVDEAGALAQQVRGKAAEVAESAAGAIDAATSVAQMLQDAKGELSDAVAGNAGEFDELADAIDQALSATEGQPDDAVASLREAAAAADANAASQRELAAQLRALAAEMEESEAGGSTGGSTGNGQVDPDAAISSATLISMAEDLEAAAAVQEQARDGLNAAADDIEQGVVTSQEVRDQARELAEEAKESLEDVRDTIEGQLAPVLKQLAGDVDAAVGSLAEVGDLLGAAAEALSSSADSADAADAGSAAAQIAQASAGLVSAANSLDSQAAELHALSQDISTALVAGDTQELRAVLSSDPATLASAFSAPVGIDRHAVYPVDNFGSAMAPLYTTLALWIGALLAMVAIKPNPSARTLEELGDMSLAQQFMGRFGVVALVSLAQSTCLALGNMLFLQVQVNEPALYLLCFWVAGLVFAFIVYTLVATFGNLGKALAVLLLIMQVSGGGGSYPLPLLPQFIQDMSPFLPVTHAVDAMRAAMFGVYQSDFWLEMAALIAFVIPFVLLGLALRAPLSKLVEKFVQKVESTKVM